MSPQRTRRRYTAELKVEVALAALTERQPLAELTVRYQLAPAQITRWKQHLRQQAARVFVADTPFPTATIPDMESLYAAMVHLQMENALLKKRSPDDHGPAAPIGAGPRPGGPLRHGPLPDYGPGAQQLLLPIKREDRVGPEAHMPARREVYPPQIQGPARVSRPARICYASERPRLPTRCEAQT